MRTVVLFCLTLFFLLFKGNDKIYAAHFSQGKTNVQFESESRHTDKPFHKLHQLHAQKDPTPRENTYLEESKDEDESTRNTLVSTKQDTTFCYKSLLVNQQTNQKLALPYCEHLSYTASFKYLLLKVFRI